MTNIAYPAGLHHAMIDRTWAIWQLQDFANRQQVIAVSLIHSSVFEPFFLWTYTLTPLKQGGSSMMGGGKAQSLDDVINLYAVNSKTYKIRELVSLVDGPFCYYYA